MMVPTNPGEEILPIKVSEGLFNGNRSKPYA